MKYKKMQEICNECGKSVAFGSGNFVNRVIDFNSVSQRKRDDKPFPSGDYICAECDTLNSFEQVNI